MIALIEHLKIEKVNLLGTSGGAWVAINTALKRPDLIDKVIADSFDGRTLHENFAENLLQEREFAKHDIQAKQFYEWCQGEDWETVVDLNTQALTKCATNQIPLFCNPQIFWIPNKFDLAKAGSFFEMEKCTFGSVFVPDFFNI